LASHPDNDGGGTWTRRRIIIIIIISILYGLWFNFLDSAAYCDDSVDGRHCIPVGQILGNNDVYQPWNIIGHCIPGLFMLLFEPRKAELFIAGVLISSAVMDSPLWGVARSLHGLPLWHIEGDNLFAPTYNIVQWIVYYYNPLGFYQVWGDYWLAPGLPNASMIFWSIVLRLVGAVLLIWWQDRQESMGEEFSLKKLLLSENRLRNRIQRGNSEKSTKK
jgi:hypothetical protein